MRVSMPFEKLMELGAALTEDVSMGELAERWGEPAERIIDALVAVDVMNGVRTYDESRHPWFRQQSPNDA